MVESVQATDPQRQSEIWDEAIRAVLEGAAKAVPPLGRAEWRVFAAVLHETAARSQQTCVLSVAMIQEYSGIASDRLVRAALTSLRDRKLITYEARRGRPRAGEPGRCHVGVPYAHSEQQAKAAPLSTG